MQVSCGVDSEIQNAFELEVADLIRKVRLGNYRTPGIEIEDNA